MANITTRATAGSWPTNGSTVTNNNASLTNAQVDANFININNELLTKVSSGTTGKVYTTVNGAVSGASSMTVATSAGIAVGSVLQAETGTVPANTQVLTIVGNVLTLSASVTISNGVNVSFARFPNAIGYVTSIPSSSNPDAESHKIGLVGEAVGSVVTLTATGGAYDGNTITFASTTGVLVGMIVTGTGIPSNLNLGASNNGTTFQVNNTFVVTAVTPTSISFGSANGIVGFTLSATASGTYTFVQIGVGLYGTGYTLGGARSGGVVGEGHVSASADTGASIGVRGYAHDDHSGGANIGLYGTAYNGSGSAYSLYLNEGNIYTNNNIDWICAPGTTVSLPTRIGGGKLHLNALSSGVGSSEFEICGGYQGSITIGAGTDMTSATGSPIYPSLNTEQYFTMTQQENVFIGDSIAYRAIALSSTGSINGNTVMGYGAGSWLDGVGGGGSSINSVIIGRFAGVDGYYSAGATGFNGDRNILIGQYAGGNAGKTGLTGALNTSGVTCIGSRHQLMKVDGSGVTATGGGMLLGHGTMSGEFIRAQRGAYDGTAQSNHHMISMNGAILYGESGWGSDGRTNATAQLNIISTISSTITPSMMFNRTIMVTYNSTASASLPNASTILSKIGDGVWYLNQCIRWTIFPTKTTVSLNVNHTSIGSTYAANATGNGIGVSVITFASTTGIYTGMGISGAGIPVGTVVGTVTATQVNLVDISGASVTLTVAGNSTNYAFYTHFYGNATNSANSVTVTTSAVNFTTYRTGTYANPCFMTLIG